MFLACQQTIPVTGVKFPVTKVTYWASPALLFQGGGGKGVLTGFLSAARPGWYSWEADAGRTTFTILCWTQRARPPPPIKSRGGSRNPHVCAASVRRRRRCADVRIASRSRGKVLPRVRRFLLWTHGEEKLSMQVLPAGYVTPRLATLNHPGDHPVNEAASLQPSGKQ